MPVLRAGARHPLLDDDGPTVLEVLRVVRVTTVAFAFVAAIMLAIGLTFVRHENAKDIARVQAQRLESCEQLNRRFKIAGDRLLVVLEASRDPDGARRSLKPFLDALEPQDCEKTIKEIR